MYAMQYEVKLPSDYNMEIIKKRVRENGFKTDGFEDLIIKAYLISDEDNITKSYSPLYLWRNSKGMTKFIFDGYFDNIISSFGWHSINIGVTYLVNITDDVCNSKYVLEEYININPSSSLKNHDIENKFYSFDNILAQSIIYNPDKWKAVKYSFVNEVPKNIDKKVQVYQILHISQ